MSGRRTQSPRPPARRLSSRLGRPTGEPFDFTASMARLCEDIADRSETFSHLDMSRCLVTISQARNRNAWGTQAKLTPLRFEGGARTTVRRGRQWGCQSVVHDGRDMLYVVTFVLPRFQDQTPREKLITVFHELYHISPDFNGDIRRFPGRCHAHTGSQKQYDAHMGELVDEYLSCEPPRSLYEWLGLSFDELTERHGSVTGLKIRIPKLLPVAATS